MTSFNVEGLLANRSVTAGAAIKVIQRDADNSTSSSNRQVLGNDSGVTVTLSPAATKISLLLKSESTGSASAAVDFDAFLDSNHQQIEAYGKSADFLQELPEDLNQERQILAQQAANYLLAHHYGEEKLYNNRTAENPFASLDRVALSKISFNDSGLFTAAERQVAFLEMTNRDMVHRNETYDLSEKLTRADGSAPWHLVTSFLRDAQLIGTMSEGEKAWRHWPPATELEAFAASMLRNDPTKQPTLPEYQNLNNQDKPILAFMVGKDGSGSWKNISIEELASDTLPLRLIHSLIEKNKATQPEHPWLSLYLSIDSLGK
ncbi:hypothetical protein VUJ49_06490 [Pseudomonas berkeleyensis]|uniref:Uncharacterized protein n=1 Tax=Pseudomonas berkeleyensis TaxID=2726956 RepID=A0A7G5DSH5_9PSED|nr:hypothetical protein [Pseudomonas berkeleyensis]QMV64700.1 hypothetical protein HS968_06465 [Pseudomonas berkeleyensis]WSO40168.1 hypothetical protein VUJ49_06490 [Pseudomonas berkeleyensis]